MGCVSADGTVSESGKRMLRTLQSPASPEKLAQDLNRPVYIVRSSLREMEQAGLLSRRGEDYVTTEAGKAKL